PTNEDYMTRKIYDFTGNKINKLTCLVSNTGKRSKTNQIIGLWKCDCGCIKEIRNVAVNTGRTKSCGCYKKQNIKPKFGINHKNWKGYKGISGSIWFRIISCAKKRNKEIKISIEYIWGLFEKQNGLCALSGLPIYIAKSS